MLLIDKSVCFRLCVEQVTSERVERSKLHLRLFTPEESLQNAQTFLDSSILLFVPCHADLVLQILQLVCITLVKEALLLACIELDCPWFKGRHDTAETRQEIEIRCRLEIRNYVWVTLRLY